METAVEVPGTGFDQRVGACKGDDHQEAGHLGSEYG